MRTTIVLDDDLIEAAGRTHGKARKYFFFEKKNCFSMACLPLAVSRSQRGMV